MEGATICPSALLTLFLGLNGLLIYGDFQGDVIAFLAIHHINAIPIRRI